MEKIKILLVDDESELVYPMSERLEMRGFEVKVATIWSDALKFFDSNKFDVALLDIKIPGMNGIDLMKLIFQLQPDIKILLMSGHGTEDDERDCIAKGACGLMIKPVKMVNLINKIHSLLGIEE